jgi:hypothetical protein
MKRLCEKRGAHGRPQKSTLTFAIWRVLICSEGGLNLFFLVEIAKSLFFTQPLNAELRRGAGFGVDRFTIV